VASGSASASQGAVEPGYRGGTDKDDAVEDPTERGIHHDKGARDLDSEQLARCRRDLVWGESRD